MTGNDRRCLKFYFPRVIKQVRYKDHAHGGKVFTHKIAPDVTKLRTNGKIFRLIGAIGGHTANMVRF